jgi:hypothetical protein
VDAERITARAGKTGPHTRALAEAIHNAHKLDVKGASRRRPEDDTTTK